jgi:hypothetical protein
MDRLEVCKEILEPIRMHMEAFCTCITLDEMIMHGHCISAELLFKVIDDWLATIVITCNLFPVFANITVSKRRSGLVVSFGVYPSFDHTSQVLVQSCRNRRNRRTLSCRLAKLPSSILNLRNKFNQTSRPGTHLGLKPPKAEEFQFGHG